jgi:hypothetical protein
MRIRDGKISSYEIGHLFEAATNPQEVGTSTYDSAVNLKRFISNPPFQAISGLDLGPNLTLQLGQVKE